MNNKLKILTTFIIILTAFMLIISPAAAQSASEPTAFLFYYDDDFELEVFDGSGDYISDVFIGMELFPGSTIKTYNSTAEIQLEPNGSVLKVSENSIFQIEAFQTTADESNDFSLFNGKLRVIAARAGLGYENYSIITQSAVCGVRGTDFVIDSIGVLAVKDGAVEFSSLLSGETIDVISGQIADVFADSFKAAAASAQTLSSLFSGLDFKGADPAQVPGHTPQPEDSSDEGTVSDDDEADDEDTEEPSDEQETGDGAEDSGDSESQDDQTADNSGDDQQTSDPSGDAEKDAGQQDKEPRVTPKPSRTGSAAASITAKRADEAASGDKEGEDAAEDEKAEQTDNFLSRLFDLFAFEIGSINVDGTTYAKAVLQPEFEIGKLKASLYLPVIYQDNLFDPSGWYQPAGNNEWSFGTDQTEAVDIAFDIMSDLFLKIEYIQWGDNGDDFYLKFGNLDNMSIGHGILMKDFTNNFEFPAIRKVGLNTGFNFERFGFEAVLDDAASPTIFGGRLVLIPFGSSFPLGIGLSAITDINPDSETEPTPELWDPLILNAALDLGIPVTPLHLTLFADAAGLVLYSDNVWHTETFYNDDEADFLTALNNYGISAGIFGDILNVVDYRLEYRLSKGIFRPAFYGNNYLGDKTAQYSELLAFIDNPAASEYQEYTMGVYGELSANLFNAVTLGGGYLWPWQIDETGAVDFTADDSFSLSAALMPDVIPVAGLYGSVSYTRTGFVNSIKNAASGAETFALIDQDTIFKGELVYPFDPSLDIALQFATTFSRDADGQLELDADNQPLDPYFAMSIDMRVHF